MARVSSNTLFNITDSYDYLIDNLKNGIYCQSTFEKLPFGKNGYRVPLISFCDIPLSLIKEHFDWYGRYGIGIKRSYARENGVQPVWYVTSENYLVQKIVKSPLSEVDRKYILPYLKQFMGKQKHRSDGIFKMKKFYDEREWRYIPKASIAEPIFGEQAIKQLATTTPEVHRMEIDLNEVEYIIIEKDKDILNLIPELKSLASAKHVSYEMLLSKIITAKRIEQDF